MTLCKKYKKLCWIVGVLVVLKIIFWSPMHYHAMPFSGKIIDADTKEPVEGVIVLATWLQQENQFLAFSKCSPRMVKEAVTDKEGNYSFDGWVAFRQISSCRVNQSSPLISVLKHGYEYRSVRNEYKSYKKYKFYLTGGRSSEWNKKNIELKKDNRLLQEQAENFNIFRHLKSPFLSSGCNPLKLLAPNAINEAEKIRISLLPYSKNSERINRYSANSSIWCSELDNL